MKRIGHDLWRDMRSLLLKQLPWFCDPPPLKTGWTSRHQIHMFCRLAGLTFSYPRFSRGGITIVYPPGTWDPIEADLFLTFCESERTILSRRFGIRAQMPIRIDILRDRAAVGRLYNRSFSAFALAKFGRVVVPLDAFVHEMVRHELVHIFAACWNPHAPSLLNEGLAVWLQRTWGGRRIRDVVGWSFVGYRPVTKLLDEQFFFSPPHRHYCYMISGSFTGFLLRRFGWEKYRQLYQCAQAAAFERQFLKVIGVSLEVAEEEWCRESQRYLRPSSRPSSSQFRAT